MEKGKAGLSNFGRLWNIGVASSYQSVPPEWPNLCPFHANIGISFSGTEPYFRRLERLSQLQFFHTWMNGKEMMMLGAQLLVKLLVPYYYQKVVQTPAFLSSSLLVSKDERRNPGRERSASFPESVHSSLSDCDIGL